MPVRTLSIARGSGFNFHVHGTAVFVMVSGESKIWRLVEPSLVGNQGGSAMVRTGIDGRGGVCLKQVPGEVLFIPAGWFHATLNRGITVGISLMSASSLEQYRLLGREILHHAPDAFDGYSALGFASLMEAKGVLEDPRGSGDMKALSMRMTALIDSAYLNFSRAIEMDPHDLRPHFFKAQLYRNILRNDTKAVAVVRNASRLLDELADTLEEDIARDRVRDVDMPTLTVVEHTGELFRLGMEFYLASAFDEAIEHLERAEQLAPESDTIKVQRKPAILPSCH